MTISNNVYSSLATRMAFQLRIKDILHLPYFFNVLQQSQLVAKSFRKALLWLAHLWDIQTYFYNRQQSFILSVIMCWGTQFHLVESVLKSKDVLKWYGSDQTWLLIGGSES